LRQEGATRTKLIEVPAHANAVTGTIPPAVGNEEVAIRVETDLAGNLNAGAI